jgi:hypothetical protein
MAGVQREGNGSPRAGSGAASANGRWPWAALVPFATLWVTAAAGLAQESRRDDGQTTSASQPVVEPKTVPAGEGRGTQRPSTALGAPATHTHPGAVRLPRHLRSDTGKVAGTSGLHGDLRIDEAPLGPSPEERVVVPVPAQLLEEAGVKLLRRVRIRVWRGLGHLAEVGRPDGESPGPEDGPPVLAQPAGLAELSQPARSDAPLPPADATPRFASAATAPGEPAIAPLALAPPPLPTTPLAEPPPVAPANPEVITIEADVLGRIRMEIKSRLPYFQACADAARRRGAPDVRRLQATWVISDDGSIKQLRLEGASDAQLATCITRMGGRAFPVSPGTELTIPTPIVFVK